MTDPALPYAKIMDPRSHGSETAAKGRAKFLSAKIRRKPLKRLDSDERIQGNPSVSNPHNQGFGGQTTRAQENPNRIDRAEPRGRREELNRLHQMQSGL
jgi:hypothetical protein